VLPRKSEVLTLRRHRKGNAAAVQGFVLNVLDFRRSTYISSSTCFVNVVLKVSDRLPAVNPNNRFHHSIASTANFPISTEALTLGRRGHATSYPRVCTRDTAKLIGPSLSIPGADHLVRSWLILAGIEADET